MKNFIFPRALHTAAVTFADRPKVVGDILVALCTNRKMNLNEVQKYILGECRAEITERIDKRNADAERKRKQRIGGAK